MGIIINGIIAVFFHYIKSEPGFQSEFEQDLLADPSITQEQVEIMNTFLNLFGGAMWFVIIGLFIGVVLTIIGLVFIWNNSNPKLAGIMFIIAGVLAGFITLPSILLYIAGILSLVKKEPLTDKTPLTDDQYDGTMRPL
jgi:hypothetical protein